MSLHDGHSDPDLTRTRPGMGISFGTSRPAAPAEHRRSHGLSPGARIGSRGQLFAIDAGGRPGCSAIKLLPWAAGLGAEVVRDFTHDALTVASLRHPHVAEVTDAGMMADGTPFLVLERLRGRTLDEQMRAGARMSLDEVIDLLRGLASALAAAHAAGVVHRDVRAENVFVAELAGYPVGFPKLLDFGVAHLIGAADVAGQALPGVPDGPVAPEQRRDFIHGADPRSDQFALAALAQQLLVRVDATAVEPVLRRALAWRPEGRFESVASFFFALEAAARERPARAPSPVAAASLTQQFFAEGDRQDALHADNDNAQADTESEEETESESADDRVPRRRGWVIAVAAMAVATLAIIGWSTRELWRDNRSAAAGMISSLPAPVVVPSRPSVALAAPAREPSPPPAPARAHHAAARRPTTPPPLVAAPLPQPQAQSQSQPQPQAKPQPAPVATAAPAADPEDEAEGPTPEEAAAAGKAIEAQPAAPAAPEVSKPVPVPAPAEEQKPQSP
jgi:serine/threonine protein kinase